MEVSIKVSGTTAEVEGRFIKPDARKDGKHLSFLTEYAGIKGIAERIHDVEANGAKRFNAADYVSETAIASWKYRVNLLPMTDSRAIGHLSWVDADKGLLMLDDLLPQNSGKTTKVRLEIPAGWQIYTTETSVAGNEYDVLDVEKASFVIGRGLRVSRSDSGGSRVQLVISGEWQFTDKDAADLATDVYGKYRTVFGSSPAQMIQLAFFRLPSSVAAGDYEAETRGSTIIIASSDMPFKTQSLQRLHEQLRHEIFHLWFPNGVNLSGNYDWFYEGFALYESLRLGVFTNRIRFDDYLDTLSRAYNIDKMGTRRVSLIEASKNRFSGNNTQVYARGMLVAFLCDLALLEASKGRRSTDDLVREIYQKYHVAERVDGNDAILGIMRSYPELRLIADRYVTGADAVDWASLLANAGIEATADGRETVLKVVAKPSGRQKDLLDRLGYNNWRKSGSK
jgi:predicted metalloprotease with PDZ domain